ncbi:MAG: hypothetical protein L0219_22525, partial [Phycisphaerales bacterium]|nr:hypothetical protein [Phycisphaerales bacterium]
MATEVDAQPVLRTLSLNEFRKRDDFVRGRVGVQAGIERVALIFVSGGQPLRLRPGKENCETEQRQPRKEQHKFFHNYSVGMLLERNQDEHETLAAFEWCHGLAD